MTGFNLPPVGDLDVEDLPALPKGYHYELREGNLVILAPVTFWHKSISRRVMLMLFGAGLDAFQDLGVVGDRPRDCRFADIGVVVDRPRLDSRPNLPGSAYLLVVEVVSPNSPNGEYTHKLDWYAQRGIPEYWVVDRAPDGADDDALVLIHRLGSFAGESVYGRERTLLLSDLEAEYRKKGA
ncbi:hypothetical protein BJ973_009505 [Actinoplanes tereljensis]|uniref:Uma2 family endonuclease n=1 Tax=Paractinoplanes tereljensis TaxID=571912 RepID=UPI001EF223F3|nr:Uma2 family endonuclease [Actinoplanes tereljensis]